MTLASALIAFIGAQAQCSTCTIDFSCGAVPAYPTLCPLQPADAIVGQAYESDITFWMPTNFDDPGTGVNVDFLQMTITGVTGLPFGMQLTTNDPLGIYYPPQNQFGCARLCGTPIGSGTYTVAINIIAQVEASGFTLNVPQTFGITLVVQPGTGGNNSFSFTPASGCGNAEVQFSALLDGGASPTTYAWDFGNGGTSDLAEPITTYAAPGNYPVSLTTTIGGFVLTDVVLSGVSDNWCGDVEEPSLFGACTGAPDLYFVLTDGSGNSFTSSSGSNSTNRTWNNVDRLMDAPPYSIQFFDEDVVSQDDDLGTFNIPSGSNGNVPFALGNGTYGSLTIALQPQQVFTDSDTVRVFPAPQLTTTYDTASATLCATDTLQLVYTWFNDGDTIHGVNGPCVQADSTGAWWGVATNAYGCTASSDTIVVCPSVTIEANGTVLLVQGDFASYAWSLNGTPIPGADDPFLVAATGGQYSVTVTTALGCVLSDSHVLVITGTTELAEVGTLRIYPNPNRGRFTLELPPDASPNARIVVMDPAGRLCHTAKRGPGMIQRIALPTSATGRYLVIVESEEHRLTSTVVVE
ncbi:MAG: PKD domain-containing protein [Flavobacteriales bacterium]|nr:PKD domain-containing protein [Flavobacteriales bacterium]